MINTFSSIPSVAQESISFFESYSSALPATIGLVCIGLVTSYLVVRLLIELF